MLRLFSNVLMRTPRIYVATRNPFMRLAPPSGTRFMSELSGTQTHENLKAAFAGESQANRRYIYFAQKADVEGYPDVAAVFRSTAEGETGHAIGHLEFLGMTMLSLIIFVIICFLYISSFICFTAMISRGGW